MTEHDHQCALFAWAALRKDLALMYAVPNAAKRSMKLAAYMKREGMRSGVPDICLPVARGGYHGLYIEIKRPKSPGKPAGKLSEAQKQWLDALKREGYAAVVCFGWDEARGVIERYMEEKA